MKKLILATALALTTATASADIILKYGDVASDHGEPHSISWAGIWAETNNCNQCIALFAVETYKVSGDTPRDRLAGIDYVVKFPENSDGAIRTNFGFAVADQGLQQGEVFNFHFGISMELKKLVYGRYSILLSYDHFSNGKTLFDRDHVLINEPLDLVSIGIGF